ncbi:MAG: hypothetical protein JRI23_28360 [Deltaproteobacteria bacterium]|jgi:hypothetical protein|nr:hypothetical protein [Deltaproteobacteria bacterium]MBW2536010.1 hypothetical protein [Deltaproteobacteria bacterium]
MGNPVESAESNATDAEIGVVRDLVDRALRDLSAAPPEHQARLPWDAAGKARQALGALATTPLGADDYFLRHDHACQSIELLHRDLEQLLGEGGWCRRLSSALELLRRQREVAMSVRAEQGRAFATETGAPAVAAGAQLRASLAVPHTRPLDGCDWTPLVERLVGARARSGQAERAEEPVDAPADQQLREMAVRYLRTIGGMWHARKVAGAHPWHLSIPSFEQMLLDNLDGFFGLGGEGLFGRRSSSLSPAAAAMPGGLAAGCDRIDCLARFGSESRSDPARAFVLSFVLCCCEGDEPVRLAVWGLSKAHPSTLPAHTDALALAPSMAIAPAVERLCQEQDTLLVRLSLNVLRRRREGGFGVIAPLLGHPNAAIRRGVARCLGVLGPREAVVGLVEPALDDELDDAAAGLLAETLIRRDRPRGLSYVRSRLVEESQCQYSVSRRGRWTMMRLVALAGDGTDLELLCSLVQSPEEIALLGWHGHPGAVDALLAIVQEPEPPSLLDALGETRPQAAARALQRITGAVEDEEPRGPRGGRADAVPGDAEWWTAWWQERRGDFSHRLKYRWGRPYDPAATIDELSRPGVPADSRELAELELAIVLGNPLTPDVGDWAQRQTEALALLGRQLAAAAGGAASKVHSPGEWLAHRLGKRHRSDEAFRDSPR